MEWLTKQNEIRRVSENFQSFNKAMEWPHKVNEVLAIV